jgi:hypothetical protein
MNKGNIRTVANHHVFKEAVPPNRESTAKLNAAEPGILILLKVLYI